MTSRKYIYLLILASSILFGQNLKKEKEEKECGDKKTCKQMKSCEEAKFYLEKCGLKKLDKDKDGIPCESICGK